MMLPIPHKYLPREYQKPLWRAFFQDGKKRAVIVWHRRAGKDKTCLNITINKAMERIGAYYYFFPTLTQARRVIWQGRDKEGLSFLEHIPKHLIKGKPNQAQMKIDLINGSSIYFLGADNYDANMGTNPVGIVMSEFALINPLSWQYFRPILSENDGWIIFESTPRGKNHLYKMLRNAQNNTDFFSQVLTIEDTKVVSLEEIEKARKEGMDEETIQQEYYCSFDSGIKGAYFAAELKKAYDDGRVKDFEISPHAPTYTFWDLGVSDPMAIWVMQKVENQLRMCFYYQNQGGGIKHGIDWLLQLQQKYQLTFKQHFGPHDIGNRETFSGRSRIDEAREFGFNFFQVRRAKRVIDDINATRGIFHRVHFHAKNCEIGIAALQEYHAHYDERHDIWGEPVHNWASHGADAFRTFGIAWCEMVENFPNYQETIQRQDWNARV